MMLKKGLILIILLAFALILFNVISEYKSKAELSPISKFYAENAETGAGAANLVTAVVVTYRGLDTLGEVVILFLTAAIIGFFLKLTNTEINEQSRINKLRESSELLQTASKALVPLILFFGIYIFINGHLTPGGGFQGGAIIATGFVLMLIANPIQKFSHNLISVVESISGFSFVILGVLGILIGTGFLDNKIFPLGTFGEILSAGAIPIIYSFVGLKVGSELTGIVSTFNENQNEIEN